MIDGVQAINANTVDTIPAKIGIILVRQQYLNYKKIAYHQKIILEN